MMNNSSADQAAAALDTIAGLLRIISDPQGVGKEVEALKAALSDHRSSLASIASSKADAAKTMQEIADAKRQLEVASSDAKRAAEEARAEQAKLAESASALAMAKADFEKKSSTDSVALRAERDALTAARAEHEKATSAREADLKIREDRLRTREVDIEARDAALAERERAAQEILDRVAVLGERAKKAS